MRAPKRGMVVLAAEREWAGNPTEAVTWADSGDAKRHAAIEEIRRGAVNFMVVEEPR
jgi:hypothetical protein